VNAIHIALLVVGLAALGEALLGVIRPSMAKNIAKWFTDIAAPKPIFMGMMLCAAAIVLWVILLMNQALASWVLLGLGALMAWLGALCFRRNSFQKLLRICVLSRSHMSIRFIYLVELLAAAAIIYVAVFR